MFWFHLSDIPRVLMVLQTKLCDLFKLISPGFFRKDFITEDLLDIHEKPFKKDKKKVEKVVFVLLGFVNTQWYSN